MKIPTYDTPQVESRALPGVRQSSVASPDLFVGASGAGQQIALGKGLMQAGNAMAYAAERAQDRENADMLFRAETALKDDYLKFEQGVRERKGQSAWGVTTETERWFADQEKKHAESLQNDVQRRLFAQSITKLRQSAVGTISQFEAGERRRSLEESANASIVGSVNLAAGSAAAWYARPLTPPAQQGGALAAGPDGMLPASDPIAGIKNDILKRVQVLSDLNGWAPERKAFEEAKHLTNLHKQVISNLVDRYPDKAREYFETNKAEINGGDYDQIGKVLTHGETKQAGFLFAERSDIRQLSTEDQRTAARDFFKDDPDKRDAALREINTREAEAINNRERGQRTAADQAWSIYGRTGRIDDVPASVLASMDGKDYAALKEHATAKAAGRGVVTDFATYYDLRQMAVANPEEFRKVDLRRYIGKLSPSDLEEMAKLQTGKPQELKDAATLSQQLSNTHDLLKWGSGDKEKKGAFDRAATDAVSTEQRRRGRELTYEERQAVIDRLVIEGDVNGMWPGGGRRFYEVQGTPEAEKFAPEVPATERAKIEAALKRAGKPVTDAEVLRLFKQKHRID